MNQDQSAWHLFRLRLLLHQHLLLKKLSDKAGVYNEGWGIKIDKTNGNTISVNHNLGNNMNAQLSSTGLILGGDFSNTYDGKYGGAAGDYAVTLGGKSNFALGNISVIAGDLYNNNLLLILFRDFLNFSV